MNDITRPSKKRFSPRAISIALRIARQQIVDGDPESRPFARQMHGHCCREIADAYASETPDFDRKRFLSKCGVDNGPPLPGESASTLQVEELRRHASYVEEKYPRTAWVMRRIASELDSSPVETAGRVRLAVTPALYELLEIHGGLDMAGFVVNERPGKAERRFTGVGELERTGYIPEGCASERAALNAPASTELAEPGQDARNRVGHSPDDARAEMGNCTLAAFIDPLRQSKERPENNRPGHEDGSPGDPALSASDAGPSL